MLQDVRFGLKLLWKEKAFTFAALVTLALCIGANTAIFTFLKAVVLEPLPYPEADRLVTIYNIYPGVGVSDRGANGVPDYLDRVELTDVFESVALTGNSGYDVGAQGTASRIDGTYVTPSYFKVLRINPVLGRPFTAEDAVIGKNKSVILSDGLWGDMFNRDRNILEREIRLSGEPYQVVGVMPENFTPVGSDAKLWLPFAFRPDQTTDDARHSNNWGMIARLKPGVTLQAAQRRIDGLNRANLERVPRLRKLLEEARFGTRVVGLKDEQVRDARPLLYLVQAAVAFVLLIGCVNVANLMLVRANVRMKELAIRFSLGADRWRLSRQLLTESVLIAVLGGGLGTALGFGGVRLLSRLQTTQLPPGVTVQIDLSVLMFSAALAVLTGLVFGSIPVFHVIRRDLNETFRGGGRTGTSERGAVWTRSALVVSQVAIAFVLLAGAGLLTLSFIRLLNVNPGFQPDNLLTARFSLPDARYKDDARVRSFVTGLVENVRALPGVKQAGVTTFLPFSDNYNASAIIIEGYQLSSGELPPVPGWNVVDEGYLPAMGIRVLRGRGITSSDADTTQKVVLIDEFLERKYWAGRNPIGTRILRGLGDDKIDWTIVGVVSSVKTGDLASQKAIGQIYFPHRQFVRRTMHLVVRTDRDDTQLTSAIRRQVMQADPELALFDVKTMPQRLSASVANQRAAMAVCLAFATLALLLAAIGIYGVLSYTVTQRTREFGIRAALGAGTKDVLAMVLGQGMKVAAVGLVIGVAGAWALTSLLTTLLYDVKPADPGMLLLVSAVLMIVALVAALVPSVRAVRIRPAVALRTE